jgi:hypothetical protein
MYQVLVLAHRCAITSKERRAFDRDTPLTEDLTISRRRWGAVPVCHHERGQKRPGLYCSLSGMQGLVDLPEAHNVRRTSVDATRYADTGKVDEGLVTPAFWAA